MSSNNHPVEKGEIVWIEDYDVIGTITDCTEDHDGAWNISLENWPIHQVSKIKRYLRPSPRLLIAVFPNQIHKLSPQEILDKTADILQRRLKQIESILIRPIGDKLNELVF